MSSVLLVRLSALGDIVQSLGAVAALRRVRPGWRLTLATQSEWIPLLAGLSLCDRVVAFERRGGLAALRTLRRELRRERFEHALDLQGNWKSAMVTRLAAAGERIGMAGRWRQEPMSSLLLHRTVACAAHPHPARGAWELVKQLAPDAPFLWPRLRATEAERELVRQRLKACGIDPHRPFRVFVGSDRADPRALHAERLVDLCSDGVPTLALLGPEERGFGGWTGPLLRQPAGSLRELVALGAVVAELGGEVVGPDRGATHVLLAAGAAGSVCFGSQDPRRTAPPSARAFVHPEPPACAPCRASRCTHPDGAVCMQFVPAEGREVAVGLPPDGAIGPGPW